MCSCQSSMTGYMRCRNRSARKACQPICALNPYNNDWTIRAKVASKTPLRRFEKNGQTNSVGTLEVVDDQVSPLPYLSASLCLGVIQQFQMKASCVVLCQKQATALTLIRRYAFLLVFPTFPQVLRLPQQSTCV